MLEIAPESHRKRVGMHRLMVLYAREYEGLLCALRCAAPSTIRWSLKSENSNQHFGSGGFHHGGAKHGMPQIVHESHVGAFLIYDQWFYMVVQDNERTEALNALR